MSYLPARIFNPNNCYLCFGDSSDDDLLSSAWDHTKDAQVVRPCKTCHFQYLYCTFCNNSLVRQLTIIICSLLRLNLGIVHSFQYRLYGQLFNFGHHLQQIFISQTTIIITIIITITIINISFGVQGLATKEMIDCLIDISQLEKKLASFRSYTFTPLKLKRQHKGSITFLIKHSDIFKLQ